MVNHRRSHGRNLACHGRNPFTASRRPISLNPIISLSLSLSISPSPSLSLILSITLSLIIGKTCLACHGSDGVPSQISLSLIISLFSYIKNRNRFNNFYTCVHSGSLLFSI